MTRIPWYEYKKQYIFKNLFSPFSVPGTAAAQHVSYFTTTIKHLQAYVYVFLHIHSLSLLCASKNYYFCKNTLFKEKQMFVFSSFACKKFSCPCFWLK